jgi:hypothetical protein
VGDHNYHISRINKAIAGAKRLLSQFEDKSPERAQMEKKKGAMKPKSKN